MGDDELKLWLKAVPRWEPPSPLEVTYLASEVADSGLDVNRVRIWVEDQGGWGHLAKDPAHFEVPAQKAPPHDPGALSKLDWDVLGYLGVDKADFHRRTLAAVAAGVGAREELVRRSLAKLESRSPALLWSNEDPGVGERIWIRTDEGSELRGRDTVAGL